VVTSERPGGNGREGAPLRRRSSCRSRPPGNAHFNLRHQLKYMRHFKVIIRIHQEETWIPIGLHVYHINNHFHVYYPSLILFPASWSCGDMYLSFHSSISYFMMHALWRGPRPARRGHVSPRRTKVHFGRPASSCPTGTRGRMQDGCHTRNAAARLAYGWGTLQVTNGTVGGRAGALPLA
jgi:hypothetical protein